MKKILAISTLFLAISASFVFAQSDKYTISRKTTSDATISGPLVGNTLHINNDGQLTFNVNKAFKSNPEMTFGAYTYDATTGEVLSTQVFDSLQLGDSFTVDLVAGTDVAFWLQLGDATIDTLTASKNSLSGAFYSQNSASKGLSLNFSNNKAEWGSWVNISGLGTKGISPNGQPLPGLIATFAIGAAAFGAYFRKRKNG